MTRKYRSWSRSNRSNRTGTWLGVAAAGIGAVLAARAAVRYSRRIDLCGRVVLITGGSRGLGLVLAREFIKRKCRVAICARDANELERAKQDLISRGGDVLAVECDITSKLQVDGMVEGVLRHFGRIDILVNNAGTISVGPMDVMTLHDYEESMKTHFWAPLFTTLAVLPDMRSRGSGRIVNISSIGGKISVPHLLPYSAGKFALVGFSEGLRAELKKEGIYVTTVCPGLMRTGSPHNAFFKGQNEKEYAWFSISDSIPGITISAERAARRIIHAAQHGVPELIYPWNAVLGIKFHGLFPGIDTELLDVMNRLLPGAGGIGTSRVRGYQSYSDVSPSTLTTLTDRAAVRNNEVCS